MYVMWKYQAAVFSRVAVSFVLCPLPLAYLLVPLRHVEADLWVAFAPVGNGGLLAMALCEFVDVLVAVNAELFVGCD